MITHFEFLDPGKLTLLLVAMALLGFLLWREQIRHARLKLLGVAGATHLPIIIASALIAAIFCVALARPSSGYRETEVNQAGRDIMAVVDVSTSMLAKDVSPNRIEFTKRKLLDTVSYIENNSRGDRLGLVLFAGESYLYCPLTSDYSVLRVFIGSIATDLITSGGSALNTAIKTALNSFKVSEASSPRLLLISDGEDQQLDTNGIISLAKAAPIAIDALGVGTPDGAPIESEPGHFVTDRSGNIVISKLNVDGLKQVASETGGRFFVAGVDDQDIAAILAKRGTEQRSGVEKVRVYNELGPLLIILALTICLILSLKTKRILASFAILIISPQVVKAEAIPSPAPQVENLAPSSAYEAAAAYDSGDYQSAAKGFAQAHSSNPGDDSITFGLANSLYKLGKYDEAAKLFSQLKKSAKDGRTKFRSSYNLGNARLQDKDYQGAISEYEEALEIKDGDKSAQFNLELAKKLLEQQKQQQKKDKDQQKDKDKQKNKQKKQDQQDQQQQQQDKDKKESGKDEQKQKDQQSEKDKQDSQGNEKQDQKEQGQSDEKQDEQKKDQGQKQKESEEKLKQEEQKEGDGQDKQVSQQNYDPTELKEHEARAWLESLSDSPVLLQRKVGNARNNRQQTW